MRNTTAEVRPNWSRMDPQGASIQLRSARLEDATALAGLMVKGLSSRLNDLGPELVVILHRQMITSSHCVCVVAEREGKVVGYVAALSSTRKFYREFLLHKGVRCALIALPRLFRPANLHTALRSITYFARSPHKDPETELVSLVVSDEAKRCGVGAALFNNLLKELRSRSIRTLKIVTSTENDAANALYSRQNCRLIRQEPFYRDNQINVYICEVL